MYSVPQKDEMDLNSAWVKQYGDAVQSLQGVVKHAKNHRTACCHILAAAIAAQLALEHSAQSSTLDLSQAQRQQRLCASMMAAIGLAHQRVQVHEPWKCLNH